MATTKTIQATVKNRTDTATNWTQKNPVLAEGEIIVVQTSAGETRLKIGDGVKTFTQLPYTDEQIYNNVVTSVNGQTGDVTTNSVEYIAQTLTDEQKKQARENIGAEEINDGLVEKTNIDPVSKFERTYYQTQDSCDLLAFNEADTDLKSSYFYVLGLACGTFTVSKQSDINKYIITPILALWKKGYFTGEKFKSFNSPLKEYSLLVQHQTGSRSDRLWVNVHNKYAGYDMEFNIETGVPYQYYQNFGHYVYASTDDYSNEAAAPQFSMKADPTTDMQIATKKYVDDSVAGTADAVLYTAQTLTDEQKKQARENVGAEENHNGLLKKELYYQLQTSFNKNSFITYIKEGDITQFSDSEPNQSDIRKAFVFLALVMGKAGGQGYNNSDFQAHTKQLYAAYQAGLLQLPLTCYANPYYGARQLIHVTYTSDYFDVKAIYENGSGFDYGYKPSTDTFVDGTYTGSSMNTKSYQALTTPPSIGQFSMAAAPASDMEIATKKYVDDKISDKELILSSSTEGSTKKFKLTIDDTGTLTASEITA